MAQWTTARHAIRVSPRQAHQLLAAHAAGAVTATVSLDLELTTSAVTLRGPGPPVCPTARCSPGRISLPSPRARAACYAVRVPEAPGLPARVERIARFSEALGRQYSLYPTSRRADIC